MISIVMGTFGRSLYLKQAISSVLGQTYKDIELIIVVVHGDTKVIKVIDSFRDKRIRMVVANYACISYQKSLGFYSIKDSEYFTFFDSDDIMFKDSIEKLYNFAKKHNADLVYPNFYVENQVSKRKYLKECSAHDHKKLIEGCYITDTSFVKVSSFDRYMPLMNKDKKNRFYRVWKQMSKDKCKIFNFPEPTFIYRLHDDQIHKIKHQSQKDFRSVRVGNNDSIKEYYRNLPSTKVRQVDKNCFTIYFPNPVKYLKHKKIFKFKRVVIHWEKNNLDHVEEFKGVKNIYNITHDRNVFLILKQAELSNIYLVKNSADMIDYIKQERF